MRWYNLLVLLVAVPGAVISVLGLFEKGKHKHN
jgi:hypothetical protein